MFHKLSWFNLKDDATETELNRMLDLFTSQMVEKSLVVSAQPLGVRCPDVVTDTDEERDQKYFYIMTFEDRVQCERAYAYMEDPEPAPKASHDAIVEMVKDSVFICWQDA